MSMNVESVKTSADYRRERRERHAKWQALAVHDDGIDLTRKLRSGAVWAEPKPAEPANLAIITAAIRRFECEAWIAADMRALGFVKPPVVKSDLPRPSIERIQYATARHFNVSRIDILSGRRTTNIVHPRQIAVFLAKTLTLRSLPEIGRRFGGRDHTTVIHSIRKIERLRHIDYAVAKDIEAIVGVLAIAGFDVTPLGIGAVQ